MKTKKKFEKWFKAQFGNTPETVRHVWDIQKEIDELEDKIHKLNEEKVNTYLINAAWRATICAANASKNGFKF